MDVLAALLQDPNWFKEYLNDGYMYYGTNSDYSDEVRGYSYVTTNRDPTGYVYFKRNVDNVTIKQWTTEGDESLADGHFESRTVSLALRMTIIQMPARKPKSTAT